MDHVAHGFRYCLYSRLCCLRCLRLSPTLCTTFMARKKSNDLKARVPILYFREGYKVKDICRILGLGKTLVYECIQNYLRHHRHHSLSQGRPRLVKHAHVNFIRQLLSTCQDVYKRQSLSSLSGPRGGAVCLNRPLISGSCDTSLGKS